MIFATELFVTPEDQVKEVVNVLSNQAESDALMFDNTYEKSRLRRARAELCIAGVSYLVQARFNLRSILEENLSTAGVKEARKYLAQASELLELERKRFETKSPNSDYVTQDFLVICTPTELQNL